jgi:type I pantothenate kinase
MQRKGFPESYDLRRLVEVIADVKSGKGEILIPVYSHQSYDVVPGETQTLRHPDIVILEGLNVLQTGDGRGDGRPPRLFVSDFFDFSIYVDADARHIEQWYVDRFLTLRDSVFRDPDSYFHRYADLSNGEARQVARGIWEGINGVNLLENILPTRDRAQLVLEKGADHSVESVRLRRL